jgi:uncharacterized membrane protein
MIQRTRRATLAGLLVALIVAAGYSLAGVPNVELVTLLVFLSGFLLGPRLGPLVGAASWGLYSALNPMGAAVPPVLAAQMTAGALIGLTGSLAGPLILERARRSVGMLLCGLAGLVVTFVFQVLVNAAAFFTFVDDRGVRAFWTFMAGGIAFTATHLIWNTALFFATLRPVMAVLNGHRMELRQ